MTTTTRATRTVTFDPQGQRVAVPDGTLLLDAAAQGGIFIDIPCGGQGRCGRCKVRVDSGEVTRRENAHLTAEQLTQGWVLSCTARVAGDLMVRIPERRERARAVAETASGRTAVEITSDWPPLPAVRRIFLEMSPPTLADNVSDLDRLQRALAQEGVEPLEVPLAVLRQISPICRQADYQVTAVVEAREELGMHRLIDLRPGPPRGPHLAVAVDIGTTTVVVYLVDLRNGRLIDRALDFNRQVSRGEDVISRIVYSQRGSGLAELQKLVIDTINQLLSELAARNQVNTTEIDDMVVAGNTTMMHLFLGLPARGIREEPYAPVASHFPKVPAAELGIQINPQVAITIFPCVAAYVGGDITAGVLSSGIYKADHLTLFMDVGTNGEIVLGNSDWMMTCACSAGPAFEGAGGAAGMRAIEGAIEDVRISTKTLLPTIEVIGDVPPLGLCGSGMISALAEMFITGVIDKRGKVNLGLVTERQPERPRARRGEHGNEFVLVWAEESGTGQDIVLTEVDIDNLIRTKAAIYAGITSMTNSLGIPVSGIEEVLIGGAFGQHINVEQGIQIGLLPDLPWDRFKFLGNTSAWGAYMALLSRHARIKAAEVAGKMTYLELIADNTFYNEFNSASFLPHTDIDSFPSVKELLEGSPDTED